MIARRQREFVAVSAMTGRSGLFEQIVEGMRRLAAWRSANALDPQSRSDALRRVDRLAWILDGAVTIPGLDRRIGLDAIIGLVPVVGDMLGGLLAGWIVVEAWRLGAPARILVRMLGNIAIDTGIGAVPVAGDLFDVVWAANRRNAALLRAYLDQDR